MRTMPNIPLQVMLMSDRALAGALRQLLFAGSWPERQRELQAEAKRRNLK